MNKEPVRLNRVNPAESYLQKDLLIRISFTTLLILIAIAFILICFWLIPPTYGFFHW